MACKDHRFIDLHIHSTASDGSFQPFEIILLSIKSGLSAIALTDHDTTDGCKQILAQPPPLPLDFLTGVEISAAAPAGLTRAGSIHMLGYDLDVHDPSLNQALADLRKARNDRSPKMIQRLKEIGFDLSINDVAPFARGNQVGRPHIAQAMLHKKLVASIDEAFDRYLGKNGTAYVDKQRIPCQRAIELIVGAGGIPVLAHPGLIESAEENEIRSLVGMLKDTGLRGIEVYYPGHSADQTDRFLKLARDFHLVVTGGSDFHGDLNPKIKLGRGTGDLFVGYPVYDALIASNRNREAAPV
ncbi:MAG: PHP domain-containing protein [Thermodesulfobacteriota bacterium]